MRHPVTVSNRATLAVATELMADFGEHAGSEAALRADRSRTLGNIVHFCRWREIERAIEMLSNREVTGTVH